MAAKCWTWAGRFGSVSVPFTRGTPLWLHLGEEVAKAMKSFSPLHEGDTSVAGSSPSISARVRPFQSPSRGGHLCGP